MSRALRLPPRPALTAALTALTPVLVLALVTAWLVGPVGVVWFVLGVVTALPVATHDVSWADRAATAVLAAAAAALGLATMDRPLPASLVVAGVALLQAPVSRRSPGAGAMLPVLAAVAASAGLPDQRWTAALAVLGGMATIVVTARAMGVRVPTAPVSPAMAWRHAAALAVTAGTASWAALHWDVTHGYWLVLTLAVVLRPAAAETRTLARDRVVGTVAGLAAAVLAVALLPLPVLVAGGAACVLLTAAWGLAGDSRRATAYGAPLLVLLGSSGLAGSEVSLALERTGFTVGGVLLALGTAAVLDVLDLRDSPAVVPDAHHEGS